MAKRFEFELETVLKVRHIESEQAKKEFGKAQQLVMETEKVLEQQLMTEDQGKRHLAQISRDHIDVARVRLQKQYLFGLSRKIAETEKTLENHWRAMEARRAALAEALRRERALELLKEKRRKEYQYAMDRDEQRALDDMNDRLWRGRAQAEGSEAR